MALFREITKHECHAAIFSIVFGIRKAIFCGEPAGHACVGLFRTGDRLFEIMIDPTCTPMDQNSRGTRIIYKYSLSELGEKIFLTAKNMLKRDGITVSDLKMCVKPYTKDIIRDDVIINGAGFDAPNFDLPVRIARRNQSLVIIDRLDKIKKISYDFTAWFGVVVTFH